MQQPPLGPTLFGSGVGGPRPAVPEAVLAPGRSASRHWSARCHPGQHTAPRCARSPTLGSRRWRTGGWGTEGDGLGRPSHPSLRGLGSSPGRQQREGRGLHLMVCSSFSDSWLRATPLVSAMNTAFPEASWAWRKGICRYRAQGSTEAGFLHSLPCCGYPCPPNHPYPSPCPPTPAAYTYPFADQVVGKVSGQHVRTKSPHHVLTVNLGMRRGSGESWGPQGLQLAAPGLPLSQEVSSLSRSTPTHPVLLWARATFS